MGWDLTAARSDPRGANVEFAIGADHAITRITIDLMGDDEPPMVVDLTSGVDGRYLRGFRFKPVRNGTWPLLVTGTDDRGCSNHSTGTQSVTVVF